MLNGPALLRVLLVVIAAAALTGLVQRYWLFDSGQLEAASTVERPAAPSTPARAADPTPVRSPPPPAPVTQPAPPAPPPALATSEPEPAPASPSETRNAALVPSPPPVAPQPPPGRTLPRAPVQAPPADDRPESGEQEIAAAEAADPRAIDVVDINTGTLSALNGLKGGGAIGRAIIQHRPYASTDQLLSKRVLSRAIYQRIKDQITVR